MRFKVGEKVRVREDLIEGNKYGDDTFVAEMNEFKGQVLTISKVRDDNCYFLLEDEMGWYWNDEMLEPAEEKPCNNWGISGDFMNQGHGQLKSPGKRAVKTVIRLDKVEEKTTSDYDIINKPKHYNQYRVEVIDIIEDATRGLKGMEAVNLGHIIRYVLRYQFKNGVQDLKKARFYLDKQIKYLEGKQ